MKTKILITVLITGMIMGALAQKPTMTLTFTAENNGQYVPLNSILIENLTQGGDTTLYAPDTVLMLDYFTGMEEVSDFSSSGFSLSQNYPNPMKGKTTLNLCLPESEHVLVTVRDMIGRELIHQEFRLDQGIHSFTFYPGRERVYFLTARVDQRSRTIKMFNSPGYFSVLGYCTLEYNAAKTGSEVFKAGIVLNNFMFHPGDQLKFTASSSLGNKTIIDTPAGNLTYTFQFGIGGIPCPGTPAIIYEGKVYNTVLIGFQCWLKQNLDAGVMINGSQNMSNDGTIEKYCYDDDPSNCSAYGGLYQWNETMQYTTIEGAQGICPPGWHLPADEEWKQLEGEADSQYGYPDPEWDITGWRGYDAGLNLKPTSGWYSGGNGTDLFGFWALPGGGRSTNGLFGSLESFGGWWTSTENSVSNAWGRGLYYANDKSLRSDGYKTDGRSVRCLKN